MAQQLQCPEVLKAQAKALGIDWSKIATMANLQKLIAFIEAVLEASPVVMTRGAKKADGSDCCDHGACCHKTLRLILQAAQSEAEHCCQCEDAC